MASLPRIPVNSFVNSRPPFEYSQTPSRAGGSLGPPVYTSRENVVAPPAYSPSTEQPPRYTERTGGGVVPQQRRPGRIREAVENMRGFLDFISQQ